MPVYEYQCTNCNQLLEVMQRIADEPLSTCKSCGGTLKKLITNTAFVLKGNGWYVTDYPSAERKKAMEAEKPSPSGKDDAAKESKADKKSDPKKETVSTS